MATDSERRFLEHGPALVAATLCAGAVAAIWLPAELPMVDLPEHRAIAAALDGLADEPPDPAFSAFVRERGATALYGAAYYRVAAWTGSPGGIARLELTLALLAWTAGFLALARRTGGSRRAASLAAPLFFGLAWHWGFVPWLIALPAVPWAAWAAAGSARASPDAPALRRALFAAAVVSAAALCHLAAAAVAAAGATIVLWPQTLRLRTVGRWAVHTALVAVPVATLAALQLASGRPAVPLGVRPTEWSAPGERLRALLDWAAPGPFAILGIAFLLLVAACVAAEAFAAGSEAGPADGRALRRRLAVFAELLLAGCLFLPRQAGDLHFAAERLAAPLLGLGLVLLPGAAAAVSSRLRRFAPIALWLAAASLGAAVMVVELRAGIAFSQETGALDDMAGRLPRGSRVLALPLAVASPAVPRNLPLHLHTASRIVERRGGIVSIPPLANAGMPVEPTDEGRLALVVPELGEGRAGALLARLSAWDFLLVYSPDGFPANAFAPFTPRLRRVFPPVGDGPAAARGPWFLFQIVR